MPTIGFCLRLLCVGPLLPLAICFDFGMALWRSRLFTYAVCVGIGASITYALLLSPIDPSAPFPITRPAHRTLLFHCLSKIIGVEGVWMILYVLRLGVRWSHRFVAAIACVEYVFLWAESLLVY